MSSWVDSVKILPHIVSSIVDAKGGNAVDGVVLNTNSISFTIGEQPIAIEIGSTNMAKEMILKFRYEILQSIQ
jgi:hypothetical protein